jgi:hypothetical protein
MKVTAIIERANDGNYCIYTLEDTGKCGMYGYGDTVRAAKDDYFEAYKEYKEMYPDEMPDLEVTFKYDVSSFLQSFSKSLGLAGLQHITGISRKQLSHYLTGRSKPSKTTVRKIEDGLHRFIAELQDVSFV